MVLVHAGAWKVEAELGSRRLPAWCCRGARSVVVLLLAVKSETGALEPAAGLRGGGRGQ